MLPIGAGVWAIPLGSMSGATHSWRSDSSSELHLAKWVGIHLDEDFNKLKIIIYMFAMCICVSVCHMRMGTSRG